MPDTEALALEYERVRKTFAAGVLPRLWQGTPGARKRGTRLREGWGGRFGVMRPREVLSAAETLEKAV